MKTAWIQDVIENPSDFGYQLLDYFDKTIKSKFNYPKTVKYDFGESPLWIRARIVVPKTGFVVINGSGTAKNAFGVPIGFNYFISCYITPSGYEVVEISVTNQ